MSLVLGIIPARGGSKGIPDKNIREICGKPLLAYTIEAALGSCRLDDVILSTDSERIAGTAALYGLATSNLRPSELATDTAKSVDVIRYELEQYQKTAGKHVKTVVLLQPTCLFRTSVDIDQAVEHFAQSNAESLISVYDASSVHPSIMYSCENERLRPVLDEGAQLRRRQEFQSVYVRNGAIYIVDCNYLMHSGRLVSERPASYVMPRERSLNIDEPYDLDLAEWMLGRNEQP